MRRELKEKFNKLRIHKNESIIKLATNCIVEGMDDGHSITIGMSGSQITHISSTCDHISSEALSVYKALSKEQKTCKSAADHLRTALASGYVSGYTIRHTNHNTKLNTVLASVLDTCTIYNLRQSESDDYLTLPLNHRMEKQRNRLIALTTNLPISAVNNHLIIHNETTPVAVLEDKKWAIQGLTLELKINKFDVFTKKEKAYHCIACDTEVKQKTQHTKSSKHFMSVQRELLKVINTLNVGSKNGYRFIRKRFGVSPEQNIPFNSLLKKLYTDE